MGESGKTVKCQGCAFLASRNVAGVGYSEVGGEERKSLATAETLGRLLENKNRFVCFTMAEDLSEEYGSDADFDSHSSLPSNIVICKDRKCSQFTLYKVGYSPKEMEERMHNAKIIAIAESRKVADEVRAEVRRQSDADRAETNRKTDIKSDRKQRPPTLGFRAGGFFVSGRSKYRILLPVLAAIVTYYLPKINAHLGF